MAAQKENEIKFRVSNHTELKKSLRRAGFRQITPRTHEWNTLYDWPGQKLRKRGELLRLRKYGDRWLLTHKAKSWTGKHKSRTETETARIDAAATETAATDTAATAAAQPLDTGTQVTFASLAKGALLTTDPCDDQGAASRPLTQAPPTK